MQPHSLSVVFVSYSGFLDPTQCRICATQCAGISSNMISGDQACISSGAHSGHAMKSLMALDIAEQFKQTRVSVVLV